MFMKKMTLKNNLVLAIAVSLIGSSSLVFANTNAGSSLPPGTISN